MYKSYPNGWPAVRLAVLPKSRIFLSLLLLGSGRWGYVWKESEIFVFWALQPVLQLVSLWGVYCTLFVINAYISLYVQQLPQNEVQKSYTVYEVNLLFYVQNIKISMYMWKPYIISTFLSESACHITCNLTCNNQRAYYLTRVGSSPTWDLGKAVLPGCLPPASCWVTLTSFGQSI